jgi:hypothetical protein
MTENLLYTQNPISVHLAWFLHEVKTKCDWVKRIDWDPLAWLWWALQNGALTIVVRREGERLIPDTGLIYRRGSFARAIAAETDWPINLYANPGGPDIWVDFCSGSYRHAMLYLARLAPQKIGWCRQSTDKIHTREFARMPFSKNGV